MNVDAVARLLLERAIGCECCVMRCDDTTPVDEIRDSSRQAARQRHVRIRTGMVDDVLAVARLDAALWTQPVPIMRQRLAAPAAANTIR